MRASAHGIGHSMQKTNDPAHHGVLDAQWVSLRGRESGWDWRFSSELSLLCRVRGRDNPVSFSVEEVNRYYSHVLAQLEQNGLVEEVGEGDLKEEALDPRHVL